MALCLPMPKETINTRRRLLALFVAKRDSDVYQRHCWVLRCDERRTSFVPFFARFLQKYDSQLLSRIHCSRTNPSHHQSKKKIPCQSLHFPLVAEYTTHRSTRPRCLNSCQPPSLHCGLLAQSTRSKLLDSFIPSS